MLGIRVARGDEGPRLLVSPLGRRVGRCYGTLDRFNGNCARAEHSNAPPLIQGREQLPPPLEADVHGNRVGAVGNHMRMLAQVVRRRKR